MRTALLALAVLGLIATACGDDDAADDTTTSTTTADETGANDTEGDMSDPLDGNAFVSTAVTGRHLVPGSTVRLAFQGGQVSASAGCNTMGGGYTLGGDRLVIEGEMRSTEMACDEPLMDQDAWLASWLADGPGWALDGATLTLSGEVVSMELSAEDAAGDGSVEGSWQLDSVITSGTAANVPADVDTPTLEITGDRVSLFAGCNRGGTTIVVTDTTLAFEPVRLTRMACPEPAMSLEASVTTVLDGEVPYVLDGEMLTLGDDTAGLVWRRSA